MELALLKVTNDLIQFVDLGNSAVLVLLDLRATFDIDHSILLEHLNHGVGITARILLYSSFPHI